MRIDAARGRLPGVSQGRQTTLPPGDLGGGALLDGVGAIADAVSRREQEAARREVERTDAADALTLSRLSSAAREDWTQKLDQDADQYDGAAPGFAGRFGASLDGDIERRVAALDPDLQDKARVALEGVAGHMRLGAIDVEDKRRDAFVLTGVARSLDDEVASVIRDASGLPLARASAEAAIEAAPAGLRDKLRTETFDRLGAAALTFYQSRSPSAGLKALSRGDLNGYLAPEDQARWRERLSDEVERRQREAEREAERRARLADRLADVEQRDIDRLVSLGLPVAPERLEKLQKLAAAAGPERRAEAESRLAAQQVAKEVQSLPPAQAERLITDYRAKLSAGGDIPREAALRLEAAENALAGARKALAKDPLAFAARQRGGVEPLDFADPIASLKKRAAAAEEASSFYGAKRRYFTDAELEDMRPALDASPAARLAFIDAVGQAGAPGMIAELQPKDKSLAHLAAVAGLGGDKRFIKDALAGGDLLRAGNGERRVSTASDGAPAVEADLLGAALAARPEVARAAAETARLAYEARAASSSLTKDEFDQVLYEQALQEALGASGEGEGRRGGLATFKARGQTRAVWIPPDVPARDFQRLWRALPDEAFAAAGDAVDEDGRKIPISELRKGVPVADRPGVYAIDLGRGASGMRIVRTPKGAVWTLDLDRARKASMEDER